MSNRGRQPPKAEPKRRGVEDRVIEGVLERIRDARNFDFRNYKRATLRRRIERRMLDRRCATVSDYQALLDRDPQEYDALLSSMLIKVTSFFRDQELWDALSKKALPQLLSEKKPGEEIRVWCAGCATGEEAFSVAILIAEALGPAWANQDIKVFGTDVDEKAIAVGRRGFYSRGQLEGVSKKQLQDWFVAERGGYCVRKEIRRCVVFGINNLVSDAPISRLDLLLCRNVFIYLDAALQKRVLSRFHYALRRHGILVLGKSELIPFASRIYDAIDLGRRVYRKNGRGSSSTQQDRLLGLLEQQAPRAVDEEAPAELSVTEQYHRDVLQALRMPVIGTSTDGTVILWNAAAAALWSRPEAEARGKKLATLSLPGLSGDLLIEKTASVRDGASERQVSEGVIPRPGATEALRVSVEVLPLSGAGKRIAGLLYLVHDVTAMYELDTDLRRATEERLAAHDELQTINEEMQSSNEELETTNEELQSANEELQTTNEELQSTNEELETTNEELQSTNAELDAINRELAHRTEEMHKLAFYQRTIIRALSAGVIVLEPGGRISMWNLAAERLLGLTETEALGQSLWTLRIPALAKGVLTQLRKALQQGTGLRVDLMEYELATGGPGVAKVTAVPIQDGGTTHGAVVIFEDMTRAASLVLQDGKPKGKRAGGRED